MSGAYGVVQGDWLLAASERRGHGGHFSSVHFVVEPQKFVLLPKALGRVSLEHLLEEPMARPGDLQRAENPAGAIGLSQRDKPEIQTETHAS